MSGRHWRDCTLGDVLTLQRGFDITKKEQTDGDYPVVTSSGQTSTHNRYTAHGPGVVIGRKGTLGKAFYLECPYWAHDTTLWVKDFKGNHERYIYYLLKSMDLAAYDVGSSNPTLNRNHLHLLRVCVPDVDMQRRIAGILSAYDDLIDVNQRRIAILEEMARRLFDEWFVRFRYPGHEAVPLVETELGSVPEGWRPRCLDWWVEEVRDAVSPSELTPNSVYVGLEHLPRRSTTLVEHGQAQEVTSTKLRFREGDILFGKIRPYFHKVAYMSESGVCSSDAIVIRPSNSRWAPYVLGLVSSDAFVSYAVTTSNGTKMPRADWKVLRGYLLPQPPNEIVYRYCQFVGGGLKEAANLAGQNTRLRAARDLLLPKLISGEIDVGRAEEVLAEAAE